MAPHHGTVRGPLPLIRPSSPGVGTRLLPTLAVLLHLLLATGCGTTSKVVEKPGIKDYPEASALGQVWVLDPLLTVERMENGKPSAPPQGAEFIGQDLARLALESLQSHGIKAESIQSSAASGAAVRAAAVEITASSDLLVQPTKPEHVTQSLHRFGQNTGSGAVLVQHVRIRLGPGG
ncbi:MAG: hypothetical protein IT580_04630, partial [Verrucomicrobiales bacterium]|nr:hypothetical protein [Verrucomicrobiales bacterium]